MKEQLISFETAKLAKQKGFDVSKYLTIDDENPKNLNSNFNPRKYQPWFFDLTQSLLQKWLREIHNLSVEPTSCNGKFEYSIYSLTKEIDDSEFPCSLPVFNTWEEALEYGLQEALKLIK